MRTESISLWYEDTGIKDLVQIRSYYSFKTLQRHVRKFSLYIEDVN